MSTLVEFLLARISDEEAVARRQARQAQAPTTNRTGTEGSAALALPDPDPSARMRTECRARREMVGILQRMMILHDRPSERPQRDGALQLLKLMAVPYDQHPAYRQEWRP
jgi:uncharacterized protein DUF6221